MASVFASLELTVRREAGPSRPALEPLPFTLRELRRAVPERCFAPSLARSLSYLLGDLALLAGLYAASIALDSWLLWPLFALAQGTLFWSLFVIGHDCGHGSFSRHRRINDLVGHLVHSPLFVPYHGWRASHRQHHRFTGNADRDEAWRPLTEAEYRALPWYTRLLRDRLPLLVFPFYLLRGTPWREGSHFHPGSPLFRPRERAKVLTSSALCAGWLAVLVVLAVAFGPLAVLRHYVAPWLVFVVWVDVVTLLHHTHPEVPWYREASWSPLRGALATIDRRYGWLERVHHHAGHHVAHHLFPEIPHYRLAGATAALQPLLGTHYRVDGAPVRRALRQVLRECQVAPDDDPVVIPRTGPPGQPRGRGLHP